MHVLEKHDERLEEEHGKVNGVRRVAGVSGRYPFADRCVRPGVTRGDLHVPPYYANVCNCEGDQYERGLH